MELNSMNYNLHKDENLRQEIAEALAKAKEEHIDLKKVVLKERCEEFVKAFDDFWAKDLNDEVRVSIQSFFENFVKDKDLSLKEFVAELSKISNFDNVLFAKEPNSYGNDIVFVKCRNNSFAQKENLNSREGEVHFQSSNLSYDLKDFNDEFLPLAEDDHDNGNSYLSEIEILIPELRKIPNVTDVEFDSYDKEYNIYVNSKEKISLPDLNVKYEVYYY